MTEALEGLVYEKRNRGRRIDQMTDDIRYGYTDAISRNGATSPRTGNHGGTSSLPSLKDLPMGTNI